MATSKPQFQINTNLHPAYVSGSCPFIPQIWFWGVGKLKLVEIREGLDHFV
jgi:hypothetical protein